jgi:hypothetical protein
VRGEGCWALPAGFAGVGLGTDWIRRRRVLGGGAVGKALLVLLAVFGGLFSR